MGAELVERTLTILKPDAVSSGNTGAILAHLEREGFRLAGLKSLRLPHRKAPPSHSLGRLLAVRAVGSDRPLSTTDYRLPTRLSATSTRFATPRRIATSRSASGRPAIKRLQSRSVRSWWPVS